MSNWFLLSICYFFRDDTYSSESIELLQSSGIQFQRHEEEGIDEQTFSELFIPSGIVLSEKVAWLSFHRYFQII